MSQDPDLGRTDWPWLSSLLAAGCLLLAIFAWNADQFTRGEGGVPLDDAWIHFQFARNLARGDGLSFNPGQPTSGSTAPLWTVLLAATYAAGGRFPAAGQALSAVCYLTSLAATYRLAKHLTGKSGAAWIAGMVVATNGRMVWAGLSALETCLFATLSLLAIRAHLADQAKRRWTWRTPMLFGLATLSRPEGYLLFGFALADIGLRALKSSDPWRVRWRRLPVLPTMLFAAMVLPYLLFSLHTSGHLLPNTYHAKATLSLLPDRDFLSLTARYLILDNPLLLPTFCLGLILLVRSAPLISLWSVGLPLVYACLGAVLYQHGRYLIPLIPGNAIAATWGLLEAQRLARRRRRWRAPSRAALILIVLAIVAGTAWRLPLMARQYAKNVDNINRMHVALGSWVAENTPADARLALNDIGAITYVSERPVLDLAGLITPEVTPLLHSADQDAGLLALMAEKEVAYVIIFPTWFPGLATSDLLDPVHQVTLDDNTIAGGDTMVVFQTHWRR